MPRPMLVPRTGVNGSGLWPTAVGMDAKRSGGLPTNGHGNSLTDLTVRSEQWGNWPTPRASDGGGRGSDPPRTNDRAGSPTFKSVATAWSGPPDQTTRKDGSSGSPTADLNPQFVASLMGLPWDWLTPSTSVATDSFRQWLRRHSSNSPDEQGSA